MPIFDGRSVPRLFNTIFKIWRNSEDGTPEVRIVRLRVRGLTEHLVLNPASETGK